MKKIIYLLYSLLIITASLPISALSPWIVVDNTTKFDFTCEVEIIYYDFDSENNTLFINNEDELSIFCDNGQDEQGNEFMKFTLSFDCQAGHTTVLNPIFYEYNEPCNPKIASVAFTHESLQLKAFCNPQREDHRYFSINYHPENGIYTNTQAISIYIKCLNNFKQTLRSIVLAALDVVNLLPY